MSTAISTNGSPFTVSQGQSLLGEIITWNCGGITVGHLDLVEVLREADPDESVARELAPRHAFSRACKKLNDARIIRQINEDDSHITFQFTAEQRDGDRYTYELETLLKLNKNTALASGLRAVAWGLRRWTGTGSLTRIAGCGFVVACAAYFFGSFASIGISLMEAADHLSTLG